MPFVAAILLHICILGAAFLGWTATPHIPDRIKPIQIVHARVLAMTPRAPEVAPEPTPPPPAPAPPEPPREDPNKAEEEKKKLEEKKKVEEEKRKAEHRKKELEKKKLEEDKKKELERKKKLEEERKKKEEEERKRKEEAERQKLEEEKRKRVEEYLRRAADAQQTARQQAESDAVAVASYQDAIRRLVARYWSRPPSARSEMQVTLQIQLVPGGEVIDVLVIESSGNPAFDRSAINAIRSAGKLPVPEEQRLFDKSFRRFKMRFRPEDLSW